MVMVLCQFFLFGIVLFEKNNYFSEGVKNAKIIAKGMVA